MGSDYACRCRNCSRWQAIQPEPTWTQPDTRATFDLEADGWAAGLCYACAQNYNGAFELPYYDWSDGEWWDDCDGHDPYGHDYFISWDCFHLWAVTPWGSPGCTPYEVYGYLLAAGVATVDGAEYNGLFLIASMPRPSLGTPSTCWAGSLGPLYGSILGFSAGGLYLWHHPYNYWQLRDAIADRTVFTFNSDNLLKEEDPYGECDATAAEITVQAQ